METNHTFAICAYKESEYLEDCIKSLKGQTVKTNIIMATSTPNDYVKNLAENIIFRYLCEMERVISEMIGILHIIAQKLIG